MARALGVNHAPKLRIAPRDCPARVREVKITSPVLGPDQQQGVLALRFGSARITSRSRRRSVLGAPAENNTGSLNPCLRSPSESGNA
jgi:hypothetical protein